MAITLLQIDAFTDRPFTGNPAAVALLAEPADAGWMQSVAAEMNLAETAFLVRTGPGRYGLRWFSPQVEIPLCGHATLASAHALWAEGLDDAAVLSFDTMSGELRASRAGDDQIELDFPARSTDAADLPPGLCEALGVDAVATGLAEDGYQVVEVASTAVVRSMQPDLAAVEALSPHAVIVTAPGDGDGAIVSRVFAPAVGIPEDPVTGSAHCVLATWWSGRLGSSFLAEQASPRGGFLHVTLDGDRVRLRGSAVTVLRGELVA
jgi:PhzF family phenazine biosynthesis protein